MMDKSKASSRRKHVRQVREAGCELVSWEVVEAHSKRLEEEVEEPARI